MDRSKLKNKLAILIASAIVSTELFLAVFFIVKFVNNAEALNGIIGFCFLFLPMHPILSLIKNNTQYKKSDFESKKGSLID